MNVTAVIPARYASTRFPGKPLAEILGKTMIQRVYERTAQTACVARVLVATDDERIASVVRSFGGEVCMTRPDHPTGTDRLAEVARQLDTDIIVNVQGDEPLIDPLMIEQAVAPLVQNSDLPMGTLKTSIVHPDEFYNPNVVKVVCDRNDRALYFSRASIPFPRDFEGKLDSIKWSSLPFYKHIGLYVYRRDFLTTFTELAPTPLEELEKLEQLRALEHGYDIFVATTEFLSQGVDTPDDLVRVERLLRDSELQAE